MSNYNYGITPFATNNYVYNDKSKNISDYVKYMLVRSSAMFQYHNLPDTITKNNIEMMLQCNGFCVWAKANDNLYVFNGGLGGVPNAYNEPTEINISNPYLNFNKTLKIDIDCVLMLNDTMKMGLLPIFNRYCTMLAETDITMVLATVNKRVQTLISANDDNTAESAKTFLKQVFDGKLGIISESKLFDSLKTQSANSNSVVTMRELYEFQQFTKASLYNEIGINANTNMKREHLVTNEVDMNSENLYPLVDIMLECRREALEKVNKMFGTNIEVEFNSSWDYRLFNGEPIETYAEGTNIETIEGAKEGENIETEQGANNETIDGANVETNEGATNETKDTEETTVTEEQAETDDTKEEKEVAKKEQEEPKEEEKEEPKEEEKETKSDTDETKTEKESA